MAPPTKSSFKVNTLECASGQWNGDYDDFKTLGDNVDTTSLRNCGDAWTKAQALFMATYEELTTQGYKLVDAWEGDAAAEFQKNLAALYSTACALADATGQVGIAIGYQASDLDTLKENVEKMKPQDQSGWQIAGDIATFSPVKGLLSGGDSWSLYDGGQDNKDSASDSVKKWMNTDLAHSTQTYTFGELPKDVHTELPNPGSTVIDPKRTSPSSPATPSVPTPNSTTPHVPTPTTPHTPTPTTPHTPPTPTTPHPTTPHSTTPTPTTPHYPGSGNNNGGTGLAGLHTPNLGGGGLSNPNLGGGGLGNPGGGGLGGTPNALGGHPNGLGANPMTGGSLAAEEAAAARNASMAARNGANGMPMGAGGGHGGEEQERERTTWLTEDEDVWGGDGDVAPPVIG